MKTQSVGGIDYAFHKFNSSRSISVDTFFLPLDDFPNTLKKLGIDIFNFQSDLFGERESLESSYTNYLNTLPNHNGHRQREGAAIDHDCHLLATVHNLRSNSYSILDAKFIILSIDYKLYRWESRRAKRQHNAHSIILPHQLFQLLRPYCGSNVNYDESFVKSITTPELRLGSDISIQARTEATSILSQLNNLTEEQATKLLSNKVFVNQLSKTETNEQQLELIELEILESEQKAISHVNTLELEISEQKDSHIAQIDKLNKEKNVLKESLANKVPLESKIKAEQQTQTAWLTTRIFVAAFCLFIITLLWDQILDASKCRDFWNNHYTTKFHISLWLQALVFTGAFILKNHCWKILGWGCALAIPLLITTMK